MKVFLVLVFVTLFPSVYPYSIDENTAGNLEKNKEDFQLIDEKLSFDDEDLNQVAEEESFDVHKDADENDNDDDNDDDDDNDKGVMNI